MITPDKLSEEIVERSINYRHLGKKGSNDRTNKHFHAAKFLENEAPKLLRSNDLPQQLISLAVLLCGAIDFLKKRKSRRFCRDRLQPLLNDVFDKSGMTEAQFRADYKNAIESVQKLVHDYNFRGGMGVMIKWAKKKPKDLNFCPGEETKIKGNKMTITAKPLSPTYLEYLGGQQPQPQGVNARNG